MAMMRGLSKALVILAGLVLLGMLVPQPLASASLLVSAIWPPTGLMLGVLLLHGWRYLPVVSLGAFGAALAMHTSPVVALVISLENSCEIALCFWLL